MFKGMIKRTKDILKKKKTKSISENGTTRSGRTKNMVVSSDYPIRFSEKAEDIDLPVAVKFMHGCINCEWIDTHLCPFGFKVGPGHRKIDNNHVNGICEQRLNYLKAFTSESTRNYDRWRLDFNKNMAQARVMKDYAKVEMLEKNIKDENDEAKVDKLISRWHSLWSDMTKLDNSTVERESVKKIEVNSGGVSLSDLHKIMLGKDIVDAQFTTVDTKSGEDCSEKTQESEEESHNGA
jgi:hypothetical protein